MNYTTCIEECNRYKNETSDILRNIFISHIPSAWRTKCRNECIDLLNGKNVKVDGYCVMQAVGDISDVSYYVISFLFIFLFIKSSNAYALNYDKTVVGYNNFFILFIKFCFLFIGIIVPILFYDDKPVYQVLFSLFLLFHVYDFSVISCLRLIRKLMPSVDEFFYRLYLFMVSLILFISYIATLNILTTYLCVMVSISLLADIIFYLTIYKENHSPYFFCYIMLNLLSYAYLACDFPPIKYLISSKAIFMMLQTIVVCFYNKFWYQEFIYHNNKWFINFFSVNVLL